MFTRYRRRFRTEADPEGESGPYIRPKEVLDPDEDAIIARVRDAIVADTRRLPKSSGKDNPAFHEPHWGHGTGLLRGTLAIDRIEALPEQFRLGLFGENRSYDVICRPNFIHDDSAAIRAGRMAVKLRYPTPVPNVYAPSGRAEELDLLFAEGSPEPNGVGHAFFIRDAREFALLTTLKPPSLRTVATLLSVRNWRHLAELFRRIKEVGAYGRTSGSKSTGWAGKSYYAIGPFALGEGAMKLCLTPRQSHALEEGVDAPGGPTERQRKAMEAWVARGTDAVFDLGVQLATPAAIPTPGPGDPSKSVMTAEYCDLQWDEAESPFRPVGTLTFSARPESDLSKKFPWSPFEFNAWNTLPEMRPLGQLFRARKHVHKAHCETRLEHIYDAKPGAMVGKAPF